MQFYRPAKDSVFANDRRFEFLDVVELNGVRYALFLPLDDDRVPLKLLILTIVDEDGGSAKTAYTPVEDSDVLAHVYTVFKERFKDKCDFAFDA